MTDPAAAPGTAQANRILMIFCTGAVSHGRTKGQRTLAPPLSPCSRTAPPHPLLEELVSAQRL